MISAISALFSQTLHWLSFIDGHIRRGVRSHLRRSAFIEPKSQDAHLSVQKESESQSRNHDEITIKACPKMIRYFGIWVLLPTTGKLKTKADPLDCLGPFTPATALAACGRLHQAVR
eukprot:5709039-Amphidinium_carterae.1